METRPAEGELTMKRLTIREGGEASPANGLSSGVLWEIVDHLAAYEDTGLEPEEIIELKGRMEGLEK